MKKWQSASVIAAVTLMVVFALCPLFTLRAQPQLTDAQIAALRPTPASMIPSHGTFWLASRTNFPPSPVDPYRDLPAYRLPDDSWLVDDTSLPPPVPRPANAPAAARSFLTQPSQASQQRLSSSVLSEASDSGVPDPTNAPPQNDPSPPQLLSSSPTNGTFWFLTKTNWPPMPVNPCGGEGCAVYLLSDGSYLVDDTSYSWPASSGGGNSGGGQGQSAPSYGSGDLWLAITGVTQSMANLVLHGTTPGILYTIMSRESWSATDPWDAEQPLIGAAGQDWTPTQIPTFGRRVLFFQAYVGSATPQRLWLYALGISNHCFNCVLRGTSEDTSYDIRSVTSLAATNNWAVETNIAGATGQFWTPVSIPLAGRPSLLLSARSEVDSSGSGIPDWWLLQYFGSTDIDPYALCSSGDGWTILQAYQNGWNPTNFYTPPAPTAWAYVTAGGNSRVIQWQAPPGPVQGYELMKYHVYDGPWWVEVSTQVVSAVTYSLTDTSIQQPADDPDINPDGFRDEYLLYALYSGGPSAPATVTDQTTGLSARLVHGPGDQMELALLSVPKGTTTIRLQFSTNCTCGWGLSVDHTIDMPVSAFTNNLYAFSGQEFPLYRAYQLTAEAITPGGFAGLPRVVETDCGKTIRYPFLDGSYVLKDNLIFTLQSQPAFPGGDVNPVFLMNTEGVGLVYRPGYTVMGLPCPIPAYAAASYRPLANSFPPVAWAPTPAPLHPWEINNTLRNFEYTPSASTCWTLTNEPPLFGSVGLGTCWVLGGYYFDSAGVASNNVGTLCPSALSSPSGRFVGVEMTSLNPGSDWTQFDPNEPLINQGNGTCSIPALHPNAYGLPLMAVICRLYDANWDWAYTAPYPAGATVPHDWDYTYADFEQFAAPSLQKEIYQFTTGGNLAAISPDAGSTNGGLVVSNLLVVSVGDPDFSVSAWLRYRLTNGTTGVYGYVEQYLDKAYKMGSSGNVTTTETGILSPYGYFFPTEPGPVALVTVPNIEDGQRGTGVVNVIKLQLDVNHDENMDLSFAGPDNTSQATPFVFWCNNNFDRWDNDGLFFTPEQDDQQTASQPDCNFTDDYGRRIIPCTRDLEDYARLWLCGLTSNLLAALPIGASVTLSWGDVANPNLSNPTIDLFQAADTDGGIGYQTNETIAVQQTNITQCPYVGRIAPGGSIQLNSLMNQLPTTHFIWCGVSNGTGGLTLTISDASGYTLAQTTAYIQIVDIKQMYERWTVGDNPSRPPTNAAYLVVEGLPTWVTPFQYSLPPAPNTPYILHVHGYNMKPWEKDRYAETAFKRLYWQGYQGRFGAFNWPTYQHGWEFDASELQAWQSAQGLLNKLNDLNGEYPGHVYLAAHSLGNVVAGEALRLAGSSQVVNTYIAMQGAVGAHAYDPTAPTHSLGLYDRGMPNCYAAYWTNGAPCYFNASAGAGAYVNFFNTNDWALNVAWLPDQTMKPDSLLGYSFTSPDLYFSSSRELFFPGDTYELFARVIQARSYALGAQPNVRGAFTTGISTNQVELDIPPYNFGGAHIYHSGQFRSNNPQRWEFWDQVLVQMKLK